MRPPSNKPRRIRVLGRILPQDPRDLRGEGACARELETARKNSAPTRGLTPLRCRTATHRCHRVGPPSRRFYRGSGGPSLSYARPSPTTEVARQCNSGTHDNAPCGWDQISPEVAYELAAPRMDANECGRIEISPGRLRPRLCRASCALEDGSSGAGQLRLGREHPSPVEATSQTSAAPIWLDHGVDHASGHNGPWPSTVRPHA